MPPVDCTIVTSSPSFTLASPDFPSKVSPDLSVNCYPILSQSPKASINAKRRKRWEIFPGSWRVLEETRPTRAVIRSPETLAWDSVCVDFAGQALIRNVDFICGLSEIIILRIPNPESLEGIESCIIPQEISIWDDQGADGKVTFNFVFDSGSKQDSERPNSRT